MLDALPLFLLVTASLSWFAGDIIQDNIDDYHRLNAIYVENLAEYQEIMQGHYDKIDEGLLTEAEYTLLQQDIQNTFVHNNSSLIQVVVYQYAIASIFYVFIAFSTLYTAYNIALKGNTLGRRMMQIELQGNVKWYSILLREFFWKHLFWFGTLSAGLAIDWGLIAFTKKKRTLRDIFSNTYLTPKGVNYPF